MSETVTMSRQAIELSFVAFALAGGIFGFIAGRVHQMTAPERRRRRPASERHTRSHW